TERAPDAGLDDPAGDRGLPRPGRALQQLALGHGEGAAGLAVVVEAGLLPRQPGRQPHLVARGLLQAAVPAVAGREPDQVAPLAGRGGDRADDRAEAGGADRPGGRTDGANLA